MKIFRNTATVIVLTLFTGLAVFSAIQLGDRLFGASDATAQAVNAPTSSSSSAAPSSSGATDEQQSSDAYSDPYGYDEGSGTQGSTGTQDSGGTTQTCPATGCTASSCHATQ